MTRVRKTPWEDDLGKNLVGAGAGVRRRNIMQSRLLGATPGTFSLADMTSFCTQRHGGRISKLKVGVPGLFNVMTPFSISVAIGAIFNNGYQLQNSAGTNLVPQVQTFGSMGEFEFEAAGPASGIYNVVFTTATKFLVYDPTGIFLGGGTVGVAFTSPKVNFTITAGGNAFAAGDGFLVTADTPANSCTGVAVAGNAGNGTIGTLSLGTNSATTATLTNTRGTYNGQNLREGIVWFDASGHNAGDPLDGGGHYVHVRARSTANVPGNTGNMPEGTSANGYAWIGNAEPGYLNGYWYGNQLTAANPGTSVIDSPYGLNIVTRAIYDVPGFNITVGGDSTVKGYTGGASAAAGGGPGNILGPFRVLRNILRAKGIPCELNDLTQTSEQSTMFLPRLLRDIGTGLFTHAGIQVGSVNDLMGPGSPTPKPSTVSMATTLDLVRQCLQACADTGTQPILIESCATFSPTASPAWYAPQRAFLDEAKKAGIPVFSMPDLYFNADRSAWKPECLFDNVHGSQTANNNGGTFMATNPDTFRLN